MALAKAMWAHGHDLQIEYPDRMNLVRRAGFYIQTQGNNNTSNWFHFAIPTPVIVDDTRLAIDSVMFRYRCTASTAVVHAVHIYDGEKKIASHDNLSLSPRNWESRRFAAPNHPKVKWGVSISIGVRFNSSAAVTNRIEFASAGCDFV